MPPRAAAVSGNDTCPCAYSYVVFGGGLPCWSGDPGDGVVVGGIGVSGGTTAQDVACAEAALQVFASITP